MSLICVWWHENPVTIELMRVNYGLRVQDQPRLHRLCVNKYINKSIMYNK